MSRWRKVGIDSCSYTASPAGTRGAPLAKPKRGDVVGGTHEHGRELRPGPATTAAESLVLEHLSRVQARARPRRPPPSLRPCGAGARWRPAPRRTAGPGRRSHWGEPCVAVTPVATSSRTELTPEKMDDTYTPAWVVSFLSSAWFWLFTARLGEDEAEHGERRRSRRLPPAQPLKRASPTSLHRPRGWTMSLLPWPTVVKQCLRNGCVLESLHPHLDGRRHRVSGLCDDGLVHRQNAHLAAGGPQPHHPARAGRPAPRAKAATRAGNPIMGSHPTARSTAVDHRHDRPPVIGEGPNLHPALEGERAWRRGSPTNRRALR